MATNTEQRNLSQATAVSEIAVEEGLPYVTAAPMSAASTPPGTANPFNEDAVLSDKNLGTPIRRQGLSSRVLPGDWRCEHCDINNFASRTACFQCGAPPSGSTAEAIGNPTSGTSRSTGERKTNHWMCPNPNCGYRNHANRSSCNRCDAPKPIDLDLSNASKHEELAADHEVVGGFGSYIYAPGRSVQGPTVQIPYPTVAYGPPSPVSAHSPSPTYGIPFHHGISGATMSGHPVLYAGAAPRTFPGYGIPPGQRYNQQPIQMKKGDWICSCGELNFARRDRCRMCGLPGGDGKHALLRMAAAAAAGASATVVEENDPPQSPVSPKTPSAPPSPRNEPTNPGSAHLMALRQNYAAQPVQQAMPGTYIPMYRHVPGMPLGSQSRTAQVPFAMQTLVMVPTYPGAAGMVAHAGYPPAAYAWPAYGYAAYGPSAPLQHYPIAGMQPLLAAGRPSSEPDDE